MKKVPKMISTKDSSYIKDMFNWNIVTAQKCDFYINEIEDEKMAELFDKIANMHYTFCNQLIEILESGENND